MKKNKGKFDFKGDWAEGKTAEEYADDLRSTCSFTRKEKRGNGRAAREKQS